MGSFLSLVICETAGNSFLREPARACASKGAPRCEERCTRPDLLAGPVQTPYNSSHVGREVSVKTCIAAHCVSGSTY